MSGAGYARPVARAVGYVCRDVGGCPLNDAPHEHIKIGAEYHCPAALTWCERCGVPRVDKQDECRGCRHLGG